MCESIARSYDSKATPRSASSSWTRVKMRPGCAASVASSPNSVGVSSTAGRPPRPASAARRATTSPARIVVAGLGGALGPAQDGPDPGDELARAERLGQVVVGAELEAEQLVELVVARGEHDDRDGRVAAQLAGDVEAVEPGQAEVEDDEVGVALADRRRGRPGRRRRSGPRSPRARGSRGRAGRSSVRRRRRGWSSSRAIVERRMRPRTMASGGAWTGGRPASGAGRSAVVGSVGPVAGASSWARRCQSSKVSWPGSPSAPGRGRRPLPP